MLRGTLLSVLLLCSSSLASVQFDDSAPTEIQVRNATHYDVRLSKSDARILQVIDLGSGQQVSPGMSGGQFALRFADGTWLGAGDFAGSNPDRTFSYQWNAGSNTLTGTYATSTGPYAVNVVITWTFGSGPDVRSVMTVTNNAPQTLDLVAHPVGLSFRRTEITGVYVPWLEGMQLLPKYFNDGYSFGSSYPGQLFAQFMHAELSSGTLSLYAVRDPNAAFYPGSNLVLQDTNFAGGVAKFHHDYAVELPTGTSFSTPETVMLVGTDLATAQSGYWQDNAYDQTPTLTDKLDPTLLTRLKRAVLLKQDLRQTGTTFNAFTTQAADLPAESLIHLVSFWPVNFDEWYPDYLPPNPTLGTQSELGAMVSAVQAQGHLVMPYTNPTWWDDEGPTLGNLGTGIAVVNADGSLRYETYATIRGGYVVSPFHPDVIARQNQTRSEFTSTIPMDLMFEDQIGARGTTYDGNPSNPSPYAYTEGLLQVAAQSAAALPIMTEGGFDRLARYETGYCNTVTIGWHGLPDDVYRIFPLAPLWAHEQLLFHSHNLAEDTMTNDLPTLSRQLAMGYNLSIDLSYDPNSSWLLVLDSVQKEIISELSGGGLSSFRYLPSGRMRATFASGVQVDANVDQPSWSLSTHEIAADGFLVRDGDWVLGGALTELYGQPLAGSSPHILTLQRSANRVTLQHPRGPSTGITLPRRSGWSTATGFTLRELRPGGSFADSVTVSPTDLQVTLNRTTGGASVIEHQLIVHNPDVDENGVVAFEDLRLFTAVWPGPDLPDPALPDPELDDLFPVCDLDQDGDVDLHDFVLQQQAP